MFFLDLDTASNYVDISYLYLYIVISNLLLGHILTY